MNLVRWLASLLSWTGLCGEARDRRWPEARREYLSSHPTCEACGGAENLEVHHVMPVSWDKTLELD